MTAIESYYKELDQERENLAKELGCSLECASDVMYLRTRNRWSPELEKELIAAHARGENINIFEFGSTPQTQKALYDAALAAHV